MEATRPLHFTAITAKLHLSLLEHPGLRSSWDGGAITFAPPGCLQVAGEVVDLSTFLRHLLSNPRHILLDHRVRRDGELAVPHAFALHLRQRADGVPPFVHTVDARREAFRHWRGGVGSSAWLGRRSSVQHGRVVSDHLKQLHWAVCEIALLELLLQRRVIDGQLALSLEAAQP